MTHIRTHRTSLILFLLLVIGGGLAIGYFTVPGAWYAALAKPGFTPPNWVFGPVWTVLYVLIGIAGWRLWTQDPNSMPMRLWWGQLSLNFLWSPVFFGAQRPSLALVIIVALLATILAFIVTAWNNDRIAAWLFVPYAAWVAFATALNAAIVSLN